MVAVLEAEFEAAVLGGEGPGVADGFEAEPEGVAAGGAPGRVEGGVPAPSVARRYCEGARSIPLIDIDPVVPVVDLEDPAAPVDREGLRWFPAQFRIPIPSEAPTQHGIIPTSEDPGATGRRHHPSDI